MSLFLSDQGDLKADLGRILDFQEDEGPKYRKMEKHLRGLSALIRRRTGSVFRRSAESADSLQSSQVDSVEGNNEGVAIPQPQIQEVAQQPQGGMSPRRFLGVAGSAALGALGLAVGIDKFALEPGRVAEAAKAEKTKLDIEAGLKAHDILNPEFRALLRNRDEQYSYEFPEVVKILKGMDVSQKPDLAAVREGQPFKTFEEQANGGGIDKRTDPHQVQGVIISRSFGGNEIAPNTEAMISFSATIKCFC